MFTDLTLPARPVPFLARRAVTGITTVALLAGVMVAVAPPASADDAVAPAATADSLAAAPLPAVTHDVSPISAFDTELLALINSARAQAQLPALKEARGLDALSAWWSGKLAAGSGALSHNPDGLSMLPGYGAGARAHWGENVAKLPSFASVTARGLFDAYFASPTHKANLLSARFAYIGISTATRDGVGFNTVNLTDAVDAGQTFDPKAALTPVGQFESIGLNGATVRVTGWALEPELAAAASTVIFTDTGIDGAVTTTTKAAAARTEVGARYPRAGAGHGFDHSFVTAGRGDHTVCATVDDTGDGLGDVALGCLKYTVGNPVGAFDAATLSGKTVTVGGWAVDPDQPASAATVTLTDRAADGRVATTQFVAGTTHAGVDGAVPGAGNAHGFSGQFTVTGSGEHSICASVAGIRSTNRITELGCKKITVAPPVAPKPVGSFDGVTATADRQGLVISGWAADPAAATVASTVVVSVANRLGTTRTTLTAGADFGSDLPAPLGRRHGIAGTVPLTSDGDSTVCVTAVSTITATTTTDLGCTTIKVNWMRGWLDKVTPTTTGGVRSLYIAGWSIDQGRATATVPVTLTITAPNGTTTTTVIPADDSRPDVGAAFPGAGDWHGYRTNITVPKAGQYKVCAAVTSVRSASITKELRCLDVTVA